MRTYIKFKLAIVILSVFCILLSSCKSKDIIANPMSEDMYQINTDLLNNDLPALIKDYTKYPLYKNYTYNVIFGDIDFNKFTYTELLEYRDTEIAELKDGFNAVIEQRQQTIIDSLSEGSIDKLVLHYKTNLNQHDFLDDFINQTLVSNINEMEYPEIKYLAKRFEDTKFFEKFHSKRIELKNQMSKQIKKDIDSYAKTEIELINYLDLSIRTSVMYYLYEQYPKIVNAIIDLDFPKEQYKIEQKVNDIISQNISQDYIVSKIKKEITDYIEQINETRKNNLYSITEEYIGSDMFINTNTFKFNVIPISYNINTLCEISKIQNESDGWGTALSIISFLGNFTPASLLLDAVDLGYGIYSEKKRSEKQLPYLQKFNEDFLNNINISGTSYVDKIVGNIRKEVKKSQVVFKKKYYVYY